MKVANLRNGGIFVIGYEWDMMSDIFASGMMNVYFWDHHSGIMFGSPRTWTTFASYILQSPNGKYRYLINPREWNHLCFAWKSGGKTKIVLVNI